MYRDGVELRTTNTHNFVLNHGALGDIITSLPAIIQARRTHNAGLELKVWCAAWQTDLLRHLLAPYGEFTVGDIAGFPMKRVERKDWGGGSVSINTAIGNTHTRNRVHMVDYAFAFLTDSRPESMAERSYPTAAPLGSRAIVESYVVFPIGATSDNKLFRASVMQPVMEWALDQGYKPVLVGTKVSHTRAEMGDGQQSEPLVVRDEVDKLPPELVAKCIDLRETTTLLELRDVLGYAAAVVGVDGGTLHLAGTTEVPMIYASGTTLPKHRYIPRHGDPSYRIRYVGPRNLACAGCQSNITMTTHDFRFCMYDDNLCMSMLHKDDFINGLKELGL